MDRDQDQISTARPIVYVRSVSVSDLPQEARAQADGRETIWAVHSESGDRLALVAERDLAFILARQHKMTPVTVH